MSRLKQILQNCALILGSTVFAVLLLEVCIRVFVPSVANTQNIRVYDPELSYKFLPHLDTVIHNSTGDRHIITNSYGYIGEDFPLAKPAGEYRIANIGDSYVEGDQEVDWDKNFVALIGSGLTKDMQNGTTYRSMDFGVSGRGQIEEYWVYKYLVSKISPDLTILWVTEVNDLGNNYLPQGAPEATNANTYGKIKYYIKKSALVTLLFEHLKTNPTALNVFQKLHLTNARYEVQNTGLPDMEQTINFSTDPKDNEMQQRAYQTTRELFHNLSADIDRDGGELLVVIIPAFANDEAYKKAFFEGYPKADASKLDFTKAHRFFTDMFNAEGITYLDLADPLREYAEGKSTLPNCGTLWGDHFTPCGHKVAAAIVSDFIKTNYLSGN